MMFKLKNNYLENLIELFIIIFKKSITFSYYY